MKKIAFFLVLIISNSHAYAEWKLVGSVNSPLVLDVYIKTDSIKRNDQIVTYWRLDNYAAIQSLDNINYSSTKTKYENDCRAEKARILQTLDYQKKMGAGRPNQLSQGSSPWDYLVPDSIGEIVHKFVCNGK
jgi:hypothetical protein